MLSRDQRILHLQTNPEVSVLVVGAGINGIGVFWDLALQGVDVLLVDRGDYASGASAASSHMAHGGIRYLENGEFRLVREAVQERNRLIENAPHLVTPLPTTFPIFKWFSGLLNAPLKFLGMLDRPSERGALVIKIGMTLYDLYTREQGTVPRHTFLGRKQSLQQFPALNPEVIFTGTYFDGAIHSPERLAAELVIDAASDNKKATPLNYVSLAGMSENSVQLQDELSGKSFTIHPKVIVNATGPWIDSVNRTFGMETRYIGGTKGSHLVLDHPQLRKAIGEHEFFFENKDGRIVLIFPLADRVLIGTTDIRVDDPDDIAITDDEVQYFLDMIKRVFPGIQVDPSQIVFTFSGVRPLENSEASLTGQIRREHKIEQYLVGSSPSIPVLSLVGGKWTTFRAFAEQAADQILDQLNLSRRRSTAGIRIGGGKGFPDSEASRKEWVSRVCSASGLAEVRVETLLSRYGTRAEQIANYIASAQDRPLRMNPDFSTGEIEYIVQQEDVVHLDDFLLRRSMLGMLGRNSKEGLVELGEKIGRVIGWNAQMVDYEIQRTIEILKSEHRIDINRYLVEEEMQPGLDSTTKCNTQE
ncbi:MAG: glycerol-3-phosphate dehydrogenase/oxidase [Anaerolineales bacterium]|nr:glycerol-3-phosphate dehydrogenase/oxidase [Anaerolineales bacterium]